MEHQFNYGMEHFSQNNENSTETERLQKFVKVSGFVETDEMKELRDDMPAWKEEAQKMIDLKSSHGSHIHRNLEAGMLVQIAIIENEKGDKQAYKAALDESIDFLEKNDLEEEIDRIAA